jgi:hypothetical protein
MRKLLGESENLRVAKEITRSKGTLKMKFLQNSFVNNTGTSLVKRNTFDILRSCHWIGGDEDDALFRYNDQREMVCSCEIHKSEEQWGHSAVHSSRSIIRLSSSPPNVFESDLLVFSGCISQVHCSSATIFGGQIIMWFIPFKPIQCLVSSKISKGAASRKWPDMNRHVNNTLDCSLLNLPFSTRPYELFVLLFVFKFRVPTFFQVPFPFQAGCPAIPTGPQSPCRSHFFVFSVWLPSSSLCFSHSSKFPINFASFKKL